MIRFSSGINQAEETVYSVGRIWKRRFPAGGGSSSTREALNSGRKPSGAIIRTSEAKSQEIKTAIQIAYEKALKEKNKAKKSIWDEGVSDRELLLDAATEENASEAVLAYARKYKAYEGLLRREERLRVRLEAARAAEQSKTGSDGPSGTPATTNAQDDGATSSGPAGHLPLEGKALRETTPQSPAATAPLTRGAMERGKGSLSYEGGTVDGVTYKAVDRKKLNQKQKTQAAVAEAMAEATGLDFVLYDGDARGTQGVYVPGGTIYLNINAGAAINKGLMVQAMGHELTHFIQENAE